MGVSNEAKPQPDLKAVWVRKRHIPFLRPALVVSVRFASNERSQFATIRQGTVRADAGVLSDEAFEQVYEWAMPHIGSDSPHQPLRHQISHEHERRMKVLKQKASVAQTVGARERELDQFFARLQVIASS